MDKRLNSALIKKTLKSKHINQIDFAHQLGVSQSAISHYLAGRVNPTDDKLQKISEILDIPVEDLIVKNSFFDNLGIDLIKINIDSGKKSIYPQDSYNINTIIGILFEYTNILTYNFYASEYDENIKEAFTKILLDEYFKYARKLISESSK